MTTCPQCGSEGQPTQTVCATCGSRLAAATGPAPAALPASTRGGLMKTMLGMPTTSPPAAPVSTVPPPAAFGRTMLGIAPTEPPSRDVAQSPMGSPPTAPWGTAPTGGGPLDPKRTMMGGMGSPSFQAPQGLGPQPQVPTSSATTAIGGAHAPTPAPVMVGANRTILGVARPGIAPLNPGQAKAVEPPAPEIEPELQPAISGLSARTAAQKRGLLLLGLALALVGTAVAVGLLWHGSPKLKVSVALASDGAEVLHVECGDCAAGSLLSLGASRAEFKNGALTLKPAKLLQVGKNDLDFSFQTPNGQPIPIAVSVPIRYRVTPRLGRLSETPPLLEVLVATANAKSLSVDGKPLTPGESGVTSYTVDVSPQLTGQASEVRPLERRIPYELTFPDSDGAKSEVAFQVGIVPLRIEAPGDSITIEKETFRLAGRTQPGAKVSVSGRAIALSPDGTFSQTMRISAAGETTFWVRADREGLAPRRVAVKVKRVVSLSDEAKALDASSLNSYASALSKLDAETGKTVAWKGKLVEARQLGNSWVLLVDTESGCANGPCLTRVAFGGEGPFVKGKTLAVYGVLEGGTEGPRSGTTIPVIRANFVLR